MDEQHLDSIPDEGSSVDDVALSQANDQNTGCDMTPQLVGAFQDELSRCFKAPVQMEHVMESIRSSSVDPSKLLNFFKFYNDLQKEKGGNQWDTSEVSRDEGESGLMNPPLSEYSQNTDVSRKTSSFFPSLKPMVRVYPYVSGFTCGVEHVIMDKLPSTWLTVEFTKDWRDGDVILLFCPITTRPGADVDAAMRKLQGDKPVILVAMYHTLDTDFSADLRRWSSVYQNVVFDIDVLFHETVPGLLKCPQNEQVASKIYKELKKYKKHFS